MTETHKAAYTFEYEGRAYVRPVWSGGTIAVNENGHLTDDIPDISAFCDEGYYDVTIRIEAKRV